MKSLCTYTLAFCFSLSAYALDANSPIVQRLGVEQSYALVKNLESSGSCWENLNLKLKVELSSSNEYVFKVNEYLGYDNDGIPPVNYGCGENSEVYYFCQNNVVDKKIITNSTHLGFNFENKIEVNEGDPIGCHQYGDVYLLDMCEPSSPLIYAAKNDVGYNQMTFTLQFYAKPSGFNLHTLGTSTEIELKIDSNGKGYFEQKDSICNYSLDG